LKFAIAILAVFCAAAALPLAALGAVRKAWEEGSGRKNLNGLRGAAFARIVLLHGKAGKTDVVEGCRLFREHYDAGADCVVLSREVYDGRTRAALAGAVLQAGMALLHAENAPPVRRLEFWATTSRLFANVLPVGVVLMLLHPGSWRAIPLLGLVLLLLAAIQLLTYPAARGAAEKARAIILERELLPPEEIPPFFKTLDGLARRHLAAPLLDCLWLRWLV
jgi:Zn-dependent membrane protease YugP